MYWKRIPFVCLVFICIAGPAPASLIITPTFDSTITNDPNAAAIEATLNTAISTYEGLFSDPIDISITFQEGAGLGSSAFNLFALSYSGFFGQLSAGARGQNDATALAHLTGGTLNPVTGTNTVLIKSANAKALGFTGFTGPDGIITLNTALTTPGSNGSSSSYDLLAVAEHEMDEVLGLGSTLGLNLPSPFNNDPSPEDLFRYDAAGNRSFTLASANAYLSLDGTTQLAQFNNPDFALCAPGCGDYGDWATGGVPQVQDAFATPGAVPVLGPNEIIALDAIGYTLATPAPVPEPGTGGLLSSALIGGVLLCMARRRRVATLR